MSEKKADELHYNCFLFLLPYHLQRDIVNFLDYSDKLRARSSCLLLRDLVDEYWTDIKISAKPLLGYEACLVILQSFLCERSDRVVSIAWKNFVYSTNSLFSTMPAFMPNVVKLELKNITVEKLEKLSSLCPNVKELTIDYVTHKPDEEEEIWFQLGKSLPQLTTIKINQNATEPNLSTIAGIRNVSLMFNCFPRMLTEMLPPLALKLYELELGSYHLDDQHAELISSCKNLKKLTINRANNFTLVAFNLFGAMLFLEDFAFSASSVFNENIYNAMMAFTLIRRRSNVCDLLRLHLSNCKNLINRNMVQILTLISNLHELRFSFCPEIDHTFVAEWISIAPTLKSVKFEGCCIEMKDQKGPFKYFESNTEILLK